MTSLDLIFLFLILGILNFLVFGGGESSFLLLFESEDEESESDELLMFGSENFGYFRPVNNIIY